MMLITGWCERCKQDDRETHEGLCVECAFAQLVAIAEAAKPVRVEATRKRGLFNRETPIRQDKLWALLCAIGGDT